MTERQLEKIITTGKGRYLGQTDGLAHFNDASPRYRSTMCLPVEGITRAKVWTCILAKRVEFSVARQRKKVGITRR